MTSISVVIPARNAGSFLTQALDSVFAQGIANPEVVVVDDGSEDETARVARDYGRGVRVITQDRSGSARARNVGLASTSGDLIAFLDADDVWEPEKTSLQLGQIRKAPDAGLVFSDMRDFDAAGPAARTYFEQRGFDGRCTMSSIFLYDMISTPTVIARRACVEAAGGFDEDLPVGQDSDLWFRMAMRAPFLAITEPLVRRRLHASNITRNERLVARCVVEIWGRYIDAIAREEPDMAATVRRAYSRLRWDHFFQEGCASLREGRASEARRWLRRAIGELPARPRAWAFLVASYLRAGHPGSVRG